MSYIEFSMHRPNWTSLRRCKEAKNGTQIRTWNTHLRISGFIMVEDIGQGLLKRKKGGLWVPSGKGWPCIWIHLLLHAIHQHCSSLRVQETGANLRDKNTRSLNPCERAVIRQFLNQVPTKTSLRQRTKSSKRMDRVVFMNHLPAIDSFDSMVRPGRQNVSRRVGNPYRKKCSKVTFDGGDLNIRSGH